MRSATARYSAFGTTALVCIAGGVYVLLHAEGQASNPLPIGGAARPDQLVIEMMTGLLWLFTVIAAGVHMLFGLSMSAVFRDPQWREIRGMALMAYYFTLVLVVVSSALSLIFSPIDWMRPAFYVPPAMLAGTVIVAFATSWNRNPETSS